MPDFIRAQNITKDFVSRGFIEKGFFPQDSTELLKIYHEARIDFFEYLENSVKELKTHRFFNIDRPHVITKKTLALEIGGSRTTLQILSVLPNKEIIEYTKKIEIQTISDENISFEKFTNWIVSLINKYKEDVNLVAINLAGAVDNEGFVLLTPKNIIGLENIKGKNILKRIKLKLKGIDIYIFNDTESVLASQYLNDVVSIKNLFVDISGTGNNCSVYTKNKILQNLETGHCECIHIGNKDYELESAVGGRAGIVNKFDEICKKFSKYHKKYDAYSIYDFAVSEKRNDLANLSFLLLQRLALYKAISFVCIEEYCVSKEICFRKQSQFITFGGMNKLNFVKESVKHYLNLLNSNISVNYTILGEDAGRYGSVVLACSQN